MGEGRIVLTCPSQRGSDRGGGKLCHDVLTRGISDAFLKS